MEKLAFGAIVDLVDDLWSLYETKKTTPLALFHRLIHRIETDESGAGIAKCIDGFAAFFKTNSDALSNADDMMNTIPRGEVIYYGTSKSVYIEIQKYLYQAQTDNREAIRRHLLTISAILEPNERALAELENTAPAFDSSGFDDGTPEGRFVAGILDKAKDAMEGANTDDPTAAIMGLLGSGIITDMVAGFQTGVDGGELDMGKLMAKMQGALAGVMVQPPGAVAGPPQDDKVD